MCLLFFYLSSKYVFRKRAPISVALTADAVNNHKSFADSDVEEMAGEDSSTTNVAEMKVDVN